MFYETPTSTGTNVFIDPNQVNYFKVEEDGSVTLNFTGSDSVNVPLENWATCLSAVKRDGMSYSRAEIPTEGDVNATEYIDDTSDGLLDPTGSEVEVQPYESDESDGHPELESEQFQELTEDK